MTIHNFGIWIGATLGRWVENAIEKSACKLTVVSLNRISFSGRLWTHSLSLFLSFSLTLGLGTNRSVTSMEYGCYAALMMRVLRQSGVRGLHFGAFALSRCHITRIDFSLSPLRWIQPINISVSLHTILSSSKLSIRHFVYQMNKVLVRTHQNVLLA